MNLAAILGIYLLSTFWAAPGVSGFAARPAAGPVIESYAQQSQSSDSASPPPASQSHATEPAQSSPSATSQAPDSSGQTNPSPKQSPHRKKRIPPCSNSPTALNATEGNPGASNSSANKSSAPLKPCPPPPPKKVIRNGGSEEPTIQLIGGTPAEQSSNQRSTEQLTSATEENLKQIAERQLKPNQQEMVNQVKEFMDQSKTAVAAGDLERGHNLALKAHLLSEELLKP